MLSIYNNIQWLILVHFIIVVYYSKDFQYYLITCVTLFYHYNFQYYFIPIFTLFSYCSSLC